MNLTPLHYAAEAGHANVVKDLLEARAAVDARDDVRLAPLRRASARAVRQRPRAPDTRSLGTQTQMAPLHFAVKNGHADVGKDLLEAGVVDARNNVRLAPLRRASARGVWQAPDTPSLGAQSKTTPLHFAALNGLPDVAKDLLEAGADVEARDNVRLASPPLRRASARAAR